MVTTSAPISAKINATSVSAPPLLSTAPFSTSSSSSSSHFATSTSSSDAANAAGVSATSHHPPPPPPLSATAPTIVSSPSPVQNTGNQSPNTANGWQKAGQRGKKHNVLRLTNQQPRKNITQHKQFGVVVSHNIASTDISVHSNLVKIILKNKPNEAEVAEMRLTKKKDILVVGKSQRDFNLLLNPSNWKNETHSFLPRLGMQENSVKTVYIKNVDLETTSEQISSELSKRGYGFSNLERITVGENKQPTPSFRLILHDDADVEKIVNEGLLLNYKSHKIERHTKVKVIQCLNCGRHNHLAADCTGRSRCIKCGSFEHRKNECDSESASNTCLNCGETHSSTFGRCKTKLNILREVRRKATYANIASNNAPVSSIRVNDNIGHKPITPGSHRSDFQSRNQTDVSQPQITGSGSALRQLTAANILSACIEIVTEAVKKSNPSIRFDQSVIMETAMGCVTQKYRGVFDINMLAQQLLPIPPAAGTINKAAAAATSTPTTYLRKRTWDGQAATPNVHPDTRQMSPSMYAVQNQPFSSFPQGPAPHAVTSSISSVNHTASVQNINPLSGTNSNLTRGETAPIADALSQIQPNVPVMNLASSVASVPGIIPLPPMTPVSATIAQAMTTEALVSTAPLMSTVATSSMVSSPTAKRQKGNLNQSLDPNFLMPPHHHPLPPSSPETFRTPSRNSPTANQLKHQQSAPRANLFPVDGTESAKNDNDVTVSDRNPLQMNAMEVAMNAVQVTLGNDGIEETQQLLAKTPHQPQNGV